MPYDSAATRSRLIESAVRAFAAFGLAGARVDQIAADAAANKRAIYDYFGSKQALFDAALAHVIGDLIDAVPLSEDDLPAYAAELFDYLQRHPEAVRMLSWRRLERPQAGPPISDSFIERIEAIRDRSTTRSRRHAIDPMDLVILTIGLAYAWELSAPDLLASRGEDAPDPKRIAAHRAAVVEATRRIAEPSFC